MYEAKKQNKKTKTKKTVCVLHLTETRVGHHTRVNSVTVGFLKSYTSLDRSSIADAVMSSADGSGTEQ